MTLHDGLVAGVKMIDVAERTLDLQYFYSSC